MTLLKHMLQTRGEKRSWPRNLRRLTVTSRTDVSKFSQDKKFTKLQRGELARSLEFLSGAQIRHTNTAAPRSVFYAWEGGGCCLASDRRGTRRGRELRGASEEPSLERASERASERARVRGRRRRRRMNQHRVVLCSLSATDDDKID